MSEQVYKAHRVLLGALAIRDTFKLGPLRFRTLARMVTPVMDADGVARQLSAWEDAGLVTGASSLPDGLPEPVYTITPAGRAEWDRMRGATTVYEPANSSQSEDEENWGHPSPHDVRDNASPTHVPPVEEVRGDASEPDR